ncbi:serine/threonine-protein kinase [Mycobacterium sp.]|uniref:serine/threonine-protein kinase n=1 Tax=Mycobacterium sp. TaxID=1785 RepID=UPI003D6A3D15
MPLAPGATFAGYTIVRMLGTGGLGEVYLAQHPTLARHDALKVLPRAMTADREFRTRFTRESEIAAALFHPHIAQTYDRGEFEGQLWIAMDYVNGTNVAQLMREQFPVGMPAGEALAIVTAVAGALDYAHQRGILHQDVKPANIFLTNPDDGEQRTLLADFGIGRPLSAAGRRTATNLTAATVAYAAPEQLLGSTIDGRADQYGLAATAFHLLTGAPPYEDSDPAMVINHHLGAVPPKLSDRHPELARLDGALSKALAKNPADRFTSCHEFADALSDRAWSRDRSPEAFLSIVDYPDETMRDAAVGKLAQHGRHGAGSLSAMTTWVRSRPWIVLGSVTAAALLLLTGLFVGIMVGRQNDAASTQAASPTTRSPAAAPTSSIAARPGPGEALDGAYQVDVNRAEQTYNANPDPQPPNVTTWWAFRSSCTPAGCVAAGIMLDDKKHLVASPSGGGHPIVLDFRDGAWQSRPETVQFPCIGQDGTTAMQTTKQVLSVQPAGHGPLRGVMTVTVESNECGQQGAEIVIPVVAGRTGDVPPGVTVPGLPSVTETPAAPTTTRTR